MTGAQERAIARLRKRPGNTVEILDEKHASGVHVRVTVAGQGRYERIITPSGLGEEPTYDAPAETAVFDLVRGGRVVGQVQGRFKDNRPAPPFHLVGVDS